MTHETLLMTLILAQIIQAHTWDELMTTLPC